MHPAAAARRPVSILGCLEGAERASQQFPPLSRFSPPSSLLFPSSGELHRLLLQQLLDGRVADDKQVPPVELSHVAARWGTEGRGAFIGAASSWWGNKRAATGAHQCSAGPSGGAGKPAWELNTRRYHAAPTPMLSCPPLATPPAMLPCPPRPLPPPPPLPTPRHTHTLSPAGPAAAQRQLTPHHPL